jgi:hypothetical protein
MKKHSICRALGNLSSFQNLYDAQSKFEGSARSLARNQAAIHYYTIFLILVIYTILISIELEIKSSPKSNIIFTLT